MIGARRSYGGYVGTIRFFGRIPDWSEPAVGIEWDDSSRGRHDGSLHGVQYFCSSANGASFVKESRQPDRELAFFQAVDQKYVQDIQDEVIVLGQTKVAEMVGWARNAEQVSKVESLSVISVANCCISTLDLGSLKLQNLKTLDLSSNLFTSLEPVLQMLAQLHVETLSLASNRFYELDGPSVESVLDLDLSRTLLTSEQAERVAAQFPGLEKLCLAYNHMLNWPKIRVKSLDVSSNLLTSLGDIQSEELNISDNDFCPPIIPESSPITTLYAYQLALDWQDLDNLPIIQNLGLSAPLINQHTFVIGHCPKLTKLNGSNITDKQREDAELYMLQKVAAGKHRLPTHRFQVLIEKHGVPTAHSNSTTIRARQIAVNIQESVFEIVPEASVQRLVALVARRFGVPLLGLQLVGPQGPLTGMVGDHLTGGESLQLKSRLPDSRFHRPNT